MNESSKFMTSWFHEEVFAGDLSMCETNSMIISISTLSFKGKVLWQQTEGTNQSRVYFGTSSRHRVEWGGHVHASYYLHKNVIGN